MVCPCVALPFLAGGVAGASLTRSQIIILVICILTIAVLVETYKRLDDNCSKCKAF